MFSTQQYKITMSNIQSRTTSYAKNQENMNHDDKKITPSQPRTVPDVRISRQEY